MSRKKKPTELKVLQGTFRKDRDGGDPPDFGKLTEVPPPPDSLENQAKVKWEQLAPRLVAQGLLQPTDLDMLEAYCMWFQIEHMARTELGTEVSLTGAMGGKIKNPAITVLKEATDQIKKIGALFGLDPPSRASLGLGKASGNQSDLATLLQPRRRT